MSKLHGCSSLVATCAAASDRAQHMHAPCPDRRGRARAQVTLVIPWLAAADQEMIFPNNQTFETPEAQEQFVRAWARKRTGMPCDFKARVASFLAVLRPRSLSSALGSPRLQRMPASTRRVTQATPGTLSAWLC